ncbi:MAG: M20/M25/M40 family metallo-hydrolase, partial [Clostridia bacterium]|nr:M20/M25/M40 family metallo-hydrolase [Clostridia bacterium]
MIQFDMEGFRKDLEYLVNIDSGTGTAEGVAQVADHLAEKYRKLGLTVKRYVFDEKYGPCLEARNHPESEEIDLLLIGHMDTVFPPGTAAARPFRLEGDKAYGPGAADMKAGDLLAVALAENLLRSRPD